LSHQRVALVTGAGQGLGRAVAAALSRAGLAVAAVGRTQAKLDATAAALPGPAIAVAADLAEPDQVRRAFAAVGERFGGLDVLVNCAAEYAHFRLEEASDDQIRRIIANTLTSAAYCTREAIPLMRARGGGDIVNISSQSAEMPQPFMTVYGAAKAGLETLSQGLRWELKGEDFRIVVCQIGIVQGTTAGPGFAEIKDRVYALWEKTGIAQMYARPGTPPDGVAAAIVHAVTAPRDVYVQTLRLRGAEADLPPPPCGGGGPSAER
jgi:NAD(P)-dependent dehydrogenase (short-subunit alcohol dehydrogenase family)